MTQTLSGERGVKIRQHLNYQDWLETAKHLFLWVFWPFLRADWRRE
jgi:hypothetical protein